MPNCTPVIFSAVYAFFEERGGEFARVTYVIPKEDPSTYEINVAYSIQEFPDRVDVGMPRDRARVFHADVALVEKMLEYVEKRVVA